MAMLPWMLKEFLCEGAEEGFRAGLLLAQLLKSGDQIGLVGDLGAGKTLLVQGIAEGLEIPKEQRITSPTFSLVNEYSGGRLAMVHIDLYRIEAEAELEHLGLEELIDGAGFCAVEWCERFSVLDDDHLLITIDIRDSTSRLISATGQGERSKELAEGWAKLLAESKS